MKYDLEKKMIIDFEQYKNGVELLEELLDKLPEESTRNEAISTVEKVVYLLKEAIKDEA